MEERAGTETGRSVMLSGGSLGTERRMRARNMGYQEGREKRDTKMGSGQGPTERSCVDLEFPAGHFTECSRDHLL